jgi:hypothetical protein
MSRLRDWWLTRRWPWWPDAMKVARDLDAEARATYADDQAVGLGRVTPTPAVGWSLRRTGNGIELRDAHGGPWVRCAVTLEPRWVSAAVSWRQVLVLYGIRLGVRVRQPRGAAAMARPSGGRNSSRRGRRASWLPGSSAGSRPTQY